MENNNGFINKIYLTALFPNMISILGGTVNVFFDAIFVGNKLGEIGLESVNQCLPVYLFLCTIGSLIASGAFFLSSQTMGENNKEESVRIFRASLFSAIVVGMIVCAAGYFFAPQLSGIFSTKESYEYVLTYVRITLLGGVFKVLLYIPFFYLRLEGKNRRSAAAMLIMTVLNIGLDWLFLFRLEMGIAGAAWASVIATAVACLLSFVFLFTDQSNYTLGGGIMRLSDWLSVIKYGSPMALNNILSSVRILSVNLILNTMNIAGIPAMFAILNNINEFSICVQNGVPQTAGAMTGIFFGEKDSDAVKKTLNIQIVTGFILSLFFAVLLFVFAGDIGWIFGSSLDCSFAVKCFALSLFFAVFNSTMSYYFNAVGQIKMANLITFCRGYVMVFAFCIFFSSYGERIWLFYPAAEIATTVFFLLVGVIYAIKDKLVQFYLIDDSLEKSGKSITFSVDCSAEKICEASEKIRDFCENNSFTDRQTMAISLSIEELLTIISQHSLEQKGEMNVRVLRYKENGIVRIRNGGRRYNPMEMQEDSLDYMGVGMIAKLAQKVEYKSALGVNTLMIFI